MPFPTAQLKKRAALIRYFLFDVDGVLSDGNIIHSVSVKGKTVRQTETKTFFVRDGYALKAAMKMGFGVGLLSARDSLVTAHRARELGIEDCIQARHDKAAAFAELLRDKKMRAEEIAYMGDDLVDLPVLRVAGLSAAPGDAHREVLGEVHYIARAAGGHGAAREWFEQVLQWRGEYARFVALAAGG